MQYTGETKSTGSSSKGLCSNKMREERERERERASSGWRKGSAFGLHSAALGLASCLVLILCLMNIDHDPEKGSILHLQYLRLLNAV